MNRRYDGTRMMERGVDKGKKARQGVSERSVEGGKT